MANSISVAVGDIDTIRVGRWSRVSLPAGVSRVTGNAAPWAAGAAASDLAPSWPQPAATRAMASSRTRGRRGLLIHPPLGRRMRGSWGSEAQPALPPRTELAATEAGDLARPRRVGAGPHSCGTAPGSHRTSLVPRGARRRRRARRVYDRLPHDRCDKTDARPHSERDAGRVPVLGPGPGAAPVRGAGRRPLPRRAGPAGRRAPPPPGRAGRPGRRRRAGGGRPRPPGPGPGRGGAAAGPARAGPPGPAVGRPGPGGDLVSGRAARHRRRAGR